MPWVPDRHIPEETKICPQDLTRPGTQLPPQPDHDPCPTIPTPGELSRKEVYQHILQYCHRQIHRYLLLYPCSLRLRQVRVEISPHQQFGYLGVLSEHCNKSLYLRGVVEGKATYDDVPPPLPRCHLKADNVMSKLLDGRHCEMQ